MDSQSYFGLKLTGGAHNSAGLAFQDLCGLICLFESINRNDDVLSLSTETMSDFTVHLRSQTVLAQVKKQILSISNIKHLLQHACLNNKHTCMIIASHFREDLQAIIKKRDQFRNALTSDYDENLKSFIIRDFQNELVKWELENLREPFVQIEFRMIPEDMADIALFASVMKWKEKQRYSFNIYHFIDSLKSRMQLLRSNRGHLRLEEIIELVQEHSTQSIATEIIKTAYESQFIKPSQILAVLGETKEDILSVLEEKLQIAQDCCKEGNYLEALSIYLSLAELYPRENIQLQCAMLYEVIGKYENTIEYCSLILANNPIHYEANHIKGTSLGSLKRYSEAIIQLEKTLTIKKTPEAHYNLGYVYMLTGQDKNINKAIRHYKACLELDASFIYAHQNISICYFKARLYELSLIHVNKVLQLDSTFYQAYGHKGELYRNFGLYDDAIEYFQECLSYDKDNYQSLFGISFCFAEKGNLSGAIVYFNLFFHYYYQNFFQSDAPNGTKVNLVDIQGKRISLSTFELCSDNKVNVYTHGICLPVPLRKSDELIFIGSLELSDKTGAMLYPMVGKVFWSEIEYLQVINRIQEAIVLFQYFDKPLYIDFNKNIQINVKEHEKYVYIEIIFGEKYRICGLTDEKTGGLEAFMDYFEEHGQCRIHLECQPIQEVFIIDVIKKVEIQTLLR